MEEYFAKRISDVIEKVEIKQEPKEQKPSSKSSKSNEPQKLEQYDKGKTTAKNEDTSPMYGFEGNKVQSQRQRQIQKQGETVEERKNSEDHMLNISEIPKEDFNEEYSRSFAEIMTDLPKEGKPPIKSPQGSQAFYSSKKTESVENNNLSECKQAGQNSKQNIPNNTNSILQSSLQSKEKPNPQFNPSPNRNIKVNHSQVSIERQNPNHNRSFNQPTHIHQNQSRHMQGNQFYPSSNNIYDELVDYYEANAGYDDEYRSQRIRSNVPQQIYPPYNQSQNYPPQNYQFYQAGFEYNYYTDPNAMNAIQQEQIRTHNYPARTLEDYRNNQALRDQVHKDSIFLQLKSLNKNTTKLSDEELFMINNLEKKKQNAINKFNLIMKLRKTSDKRYYPFYLQIMNFTLSTIKEVKIANMKLDRIISFEELKALEKLDLSHNQIRRIEGFDGNVQLRIVFLNDNLIERVQNMAKLRDIHVIALHRNKLKKESAEIIRRSSYDKLQELSIEFSCQNQYENIECLRNILSKPWPNLKKIYYSSYSKDPQQKQQYVRLSEEFNKYNQRPTEKKLSIVI